MRLLAALFVFCNFAFGEVIYNGYGLIAHIANGGGVQVEITLTNLDDTTSNYALGYVDDNGNALTLATNAGTGTSVSGTLAPHASRTIVSSGTGNQTQGWAYLQTIGTVGASAIFRISVAPWAGSEAMLPVDTWRNGRFSLTFDHTGSTVTGLAVVNPSPLTAVPVTVTFKDETGAVIVSDTFSLGTRNHRSIVTTTAYPATVGMRGTIEIASSGNYLSVLGLRFGAAAVSSVLPLVSSGAAVAPASNDPYSAAAAAALNPGPNPNPNPYGY